jgi:hypothetical protein
MMSTPAVKDQRVASDPEPLGYLEKGVQWVANRLLRIRFPSAEDSFKIWLVDQIRSSTLCPAVLINQFNRYVPRTQRQEVYEQLGKNSPLPIKDKVLNWIWRNDSEIARRYREMGQMSARQNPYLLAPSLEKALLAKANRRGCECGRK